MLRTALFAVVTLLALGSTPLAGQPWAGVAALGVEVKASGKPVVGAQVDLFFLADPQHAGPQQVTSDERGEARIYGLAEGRWFVRIRHPEYLTYEAEVDLSTSRKPEEGMVSRRKEGASLQTNKVRFFKVESGPGPGAAATAHSRTQRVPRPSPPTPAGPGPVPQAEGSDRTSIPEPRPETPSSSAPVLAGTPAAAAAPAGDAVAGPRTLRSPHDGSCFDCQPGEWAASAYGALRRGDPEGGACPALRALASDLGAQLGDLGGYAGPLLDPQTAEPITRLGASTAETLQRLMGSVAGGRCQVLALRLPPGAQFRGFQLEAIDEDGPVPCQPGEDCPSGECAWTVPPIVERSASGTIVVAGFENRSASKSRQPRLTVYFVPRSDWRPVM